MALSGSIHGSSSLKTTTDKHKVSQNFGNDEFGSDFEAYMSTNIGQAQMKNYDNYYMNGLYSKMNVAKTNYHISGKGKTAIFAICRGAKKTDGSFDASRMVMEYLDDNRQDILESRSLWEVESKLRKFAKNCNDYLIKEGRQEVKSVSLLVVVYAFSGAVFLNCGECSLIKISKSGRMKLLTQFTPVMGEKSELIFKTKRINYLFNNKLLMYSSGMNGLYMPKVEYSIASVTTLKEKITGVMTHLMKAIPERNCTCIMIEVDGSRTIMPSTKTTAIICAVITAISLINALIQVCI